MESFQLTLKCHSFIPFSIKSAYRISIHTYLLLLSMKNNIFTAAMNTIKTKNKSFKSLESSVFSKSTFWSPLTAIMELRQPKTIVLKNIRYLIQFHGPVSQNSYTKIKGFCSVGHQRDKTQDIDSPTNPLPSQRLQTKPRQISLISYLKVIRFDPMAL